MNHIFREQIAEGYVVVYLDDILIFSKYAQDHERHLDEVLGILEQNKLYAKLTKCDLNKPELLYLGHILGRDGVRVNAKKVQAVKEWPVPRSLHDVRCFLGLTNYYRKFLQGYAQRARPLTDILRGKTAFQWSEICQKAFDGLKLDLISAPLLALPDPSQP